MSDYIQRSSEIFSSQNIISTHLVEDFTRLFLINIDAMEPTTIINDISVNSIIENVTSLNSNVIIENDIQVNYNNLYSGISNTNYNNYHISSSIDELIIDTGICRLIPEERLVCGIGLEEIHLNQRYMSCVKCSNNFGEQNIRRWLTDKTTCPCCRDTWVDYYIYINAINAEN